MRGVDTNVLVRFLTRDDATQAARAKAVIQKTVAEEGGCHVSVVVLCELVWVLEAAYAFPRRQVLSALEGLLEATQFSIEDRDLARKAVDLYRAGRGDFADFLVGLGNRRDGCRDTVTFDRALARNDLFSLI